MKRNMRIAHALLILWRFAAQIAGEQSLPQARRPVSFLTGLPARSGDSPDRSFDDRTSSMRRAEVQG